MVLFIVLKIGAKRFYGGNNLDEGWFDFDPAGIYKVAISSYRASGGGNLIRDGAGIHPDSLRVVAKYGDIRTLIESILKGRGS